MDNQLTRYTVEEVSERYGVHAETVRRWIRSGQLPARKLSRKNGYMITDKNLELFESGRGMVRESKLDYVEQRCNNLRSNLVKMRYEIDALRKELDELISILDT